MSGTCDSCGSDEAVRFTVRRRYVTTSAWDQEGADRVLDEVEHWCFACCASYPHVPADD